MSRIYLITLRGRVSTPWDGYASGVATDPETGDAIELRFPRSASTYGKRVLKAVVSPTADTRSVAAIIEPWQRMVGAGDRCFVDVASLSGAAQLLPLAWGWNHPFVARLASGFTHLDTSSATWWVNGTRLVGGTAESKRATWVAAALDAIGWDPTTATEAEMLSAVRDLPRLALTYEAMGHGRGGPGWRGGSSPIVARLFDSGGFFTAAIGGSYHLSDPPLEPTTAWANPGARLLSALNLGLYIWVWGDFWLGSNRGCSGLALASRSISEYVDEPAATIVGEFASKPDFTEIAPP